MTFWVLVLLGSSSLKLVCSECLSPNVRTVLWRSSDLHRRCWSEQDIAVLYARRLFQLVLPMKVVPNVNQLIAHFKMCLKAVKDVATTKETHAMLMRPMADAIGGYLQAFGLPIAIEEYYEGNLTYSTTKRADELLKSIKKSLSTDGGRWTQPIHVQTSDQIKPYKVIPANPFENHCTDLISSVDLRKRCKNDKERGWFKSKVPLPFFDNGVSPKAIAVPFRTKTLYSLFDKNAKDILLRYYTAACHCYSIQGASENELNPELLDFDKSFHKWLIKEVVPLLHDGIWYPAFGSVYRILAVQSTRGLEFPLHQDFGASGVLGRCLAKASGSARTPWFFVACIIGFLVMFWVVVWVLLRLRRRQSSLRKTRICWGSPQSPEDWEDPGEQWGESAENWEQEEIADEQELWDGQGVDISPSQDLDQDVLAVDVVINYSDECDTPHTDEMLEAIIESLLKPSPCSVPPPSRNRSVDKPQSNYCLSKNHLAENSLLSSTCLSQRCNSVKAVRRGSYSVLGAAVVTNTASSSPFHRGTESV